MLLQTCWAWSASNIVYSNLMPMSFFYRSEKYSNDKCVCGYIPSFISHYHLINEISLCEDFLMEILLSQNECLALISRNIEQLSKNPFYSCSKQEWAAIKKFDPNIGH